MKKVVKKDKVETTVVKPEKAVRAMNKIGRPPKYRSAIEIQRKIDEYFNGGCPTKDVIVGKAPNTKVVKMPVYTITGLALYLGFCERNALYEYEKKPEFTTIIKKARTMIESVYESLLQSSNVVGAIFALKNMGWRDKTEVDTTVVIKDYRVTFGNIELNEINE